MKEKKIQGEKKVSKGARRIRQLINFKKQDIQLKSFLRAIHLTWF